MKFSDPLVVMLPALILPTNVIPDERALSLARSGQVSTAPEVENVLSRLPTGSTSILDVRYGDAAPGTIADSNQTLDLFVPPGKGPFSLLLWIHGGGWHGGSKEPGGADLATHFLPKGFAVAAIDYRLVEDNGFPAQIDDCRASLFWLKHHATFYRLNPKRTGVADASAGAHLTALMAVTGDDSTIASNTGGDLQIQAAVCWATPADLDRDRGRWPRTSMLWNDHDPLFKLFPNGSYDGAFARKSSPASYVHSGVPPMLIVHGEKDSLVPSGQAFDFARHLRQAGVDVTFRLDSDRGHDVMTRQAIEEAVQFFSRTLKPEGR